MRLPRKILIGTKSTHKQHEIIDILGDVPFEVLTPDKLGGAMPEIVEDGLSFEQNACKKACELARHYKVAVLADDSGLEVDALDGRPGVQSHRFHGGTDDASDEDNNLKLMAELEGIPEERRTARYRCVVALASPKGLLMTADGAVEGTIALAPEGANGFGYDPLFHYPPYATTFGMLDPSVKNRISHRAEAVRKLMEALTGKRR